MSDPVQHSEGMNKYTSYRVDVRPPPSPATTTTANPSNPINNNNNQNQTTGDVFQNTIPSTVLRRYSDFLWLYTRLHKERAGAIIPPLPEKQAVSRFSTSFVEERRRHLETFLQRIAVHPELYDAACFEMFLKADDVVFQNAKNDANSNVNVNANANANSAMIMSQSINYNSANAGGNQYNNSNNNNNNNNSNQPYNYNNPMMTSQMQMPSTTIPKKDGIKKWFAETKASIAGDLVRSPDDAIFCEIDRYTEGLEKQMRNVQQQASLLVKKNKEMAQGLFEFGLAFNVLGQSEADDLGHALTKMGVAADELSGVSMKHSQMEMMRFEEPLKDYLKTIHAVKLALQRRHEKRLTYTTCLAEVNAKRTNLQKLRMTPGAEAKAYGAEMSLKRGEAAADGARDSFATVSQRVLREVDRFKREKGDEMRRVVLDYVTLQIDYNRRMEQVWADLLPKLEAIQTSTYPGGDGGDGVGDGGGGDAAVGGGGVGIGGGGGRSGGGEIPTNVVTGELDDVNAQDLSQQQQQQQHHQNQQQMNNVYQPNMNMNVGQSMLGLGDSVQYRDNSNVISGM